MINSPVSLQILTFLENAFEVMEEFLVLYQLLLVHLNNLFLLRNLTQNEPISINGL